jgi:glycosyltransferase involved in cell wall biosynthesis
MTTATIVFTTHNRCDILRQALQAAQQQTIAVKILVMDDASSDGTTSMMATEFPAIEYHRTEKSVGPCYQRNRGIELANTPIVFPLDDDSILQSPHTIAQTLAEFNDERIGAVAMPFQNILQESKVHTQAPDQAHIYLTHAYVAAAHAVRRSTFLDAGSYREFFFYMGEEGDLCIRLLQAGYFVRLGTADPIHHLQPPNRISKRADTFGRQNDILFYYCNAPSQYLWFHLIGTAINGLKFGFKVKRPVNMLEGLFKGSWIAWQQTHIREPIKDEYFKLYRLLKQRQYVPIEEITHYF